MKKLFLFAKLSSNHIIAYLSLGTICFSNVLFSNSLQQSLRKTFFRLW